MDDERSGLERRMVAKAKEFGQDLSTGLVLLEAADALAECRKALVAAQRRIAYMTPMGSSEAGIELTPEQERSAELCDTVRDVVRGALAKLEGGERG